MHGAVQSVEPSCISLCCSGKTYIRSGAQNLPDNDSYPADWMTLENMEEHCDSCHTKVTLKKLSNRNFLILFDF